MLEPEDDGRLFMMPKITFFNMCSSSSSASCASYDRFYIIFKFRSKVEVELFMHASDDCQFDSASSFSLNAAPRDIGYVEGEYTC